MEDPVERITRERLQVVVDVLAGKITATKGAQLLGVSRQQYYRLEKKITSSMLESAADKPPGRPPDPVDAEKENLRKQVEFFKGQLFNAMRLLDLKHQLDELEAEEKAEKEASKKNRVKKPKPGQE